jgi:hypothetical protein
MGAGMAEKAREEGESRQTAASKREVILILAGLVVTGFVAGYSWLRGLPR